MSLSTRGWGSGAVTIRGWGGGAVVPVFCWVEDLVEYANNPAAFTPTTLASKTPVGSSAVPVGATPNSAGYTRTPLSTNTPTSYTTGVGYSETDVDYSDLGDTYDASKDCP